MIMNFLESLYSKQWFLPLLIGLIVILVILFIVILIVAIKDAKKNKKIETITKESDAADNESDVAFSDYSGEGLEIKIDPKSVLLENDIIEDKKKVDENKYENRNKEIEATFDDNDVTFITDENSNSVDDIIKFNDDKEVVVENVENISENKNESKEEINNVEEAEKDLDEIATSLFEDYKKETLEDNELNLDDIKFDDDEEVVLPEIEEKVEEPQIEEDHIVEEKKEVNKPNEQFSSIYVTPDTLDDNEEDFGDFDLNDIPSPQPVRVVNSSTIIDSSKKVNLEDTQVNMNDITTEEYHIKR